MRDQPYGGPGPAPGLVVPPVPAVWTGRLWRVDEHVWPPGRDGAGRDVAVTVRSG